MSTRKRILLLAAGVATGHIVYRVFGLTGILPLIGVLIVAAMVSEARRARRSDTPAGDA